ncbi:MAG: hypothetical protein IH903_04530, partial [Proteobacteria bacterium]|nr:hypothetical protein [Pseudomonadota bacterium]
SAIQEALDGVNWPFKRGGPIGVTERDGAFHILVPGVTIALPARRIDIGDVRITARPRPDGRYRVRVVLPERMAVREGRGGTTAILIAKQRFDGIWAPELGAFIEIDGTYAGIRRVPPRGRPGWKIGNLAIKADFTETSPGLWSGPVAAVMKNLEFSAVTGKGHVHVGSVEIRTDSRDSRLGEQSRLVRELNAILTPLAGTGKGKGRKERLSKARARALSKLLRSTRRLFADASSEIRITDIAYSNMPGAPMSRLRRLHIRIALNDLDKKFSNFSLGYQHGLLVVAKTEGAASLLAPISMAIDVAARRLPNDALWRALLDAVEASVTDPKLGETVFADRMEAALLAAGSELRLNSLRFEAPDFLITANGRVTADPAAVERATGELTVTIRGLDALRKSLARSPKDRGVAGMAPFVGLFGALGEPGTDETGAPIRRYRLTLKPDGKVLLNGKGMGGLIGAPGKPKQAPAPGRPKQPPAPAK